jgi:imidazolonepropionase-like amidohydrolase/Tol biopolymer transport system component
MHRVEFDTDEGTWTNVDVSPDGRTILFDLLGDLYTMPIGGGAATLLIGGRDWDQMARWSPDGRRIAFISDRDGNMNLWIANADGSHLKQLSREQKFPMSSPAWARDGTILVRKAGATGTELWAYYAEGGSGYKLPVSGQIAGPALSPDGRFLFLAGLRRIDRLTGDSILLGDGIRPKVSPDGRWLAYAKADDHLTALHLRDLRTGADRRLVAAVTPQAVGFINQDQLPDYAFTPDGRSILLTIGGKINRVDVATGQATIVPMRVHVAQELAEPIRIERRVADGELKARVLRWPSVAPGGRQVVLSALGKLYSAPLPAGDSSQRVTLAGSSAPDSARPAPAVSARRVTRAAEREYTPAFSPDGKWIAYTTWDDTLLGHVMVMSASCLGAGASCTPRRATTVAGRYANPAWSRDGRKLAFVRGGGIEQRGGEPSAETYFDIMWVPVEGGDPQFVTSMYASRTVGFPMRYYPVIAFDPSGTRVFYSQWSRGTTIASPPQSTLYSIRLDGTDRRGHLRFTALDEVVPSPDGSHVAFVRKDRVLVSALPEFSTGPVDVNFDSPAIPVRQLASQGAAGNYVAWLDSNTVSWIFLDKLYRQRIDSGPPMAIAQLSVAEPRARPNGRIAFTNARIATMPGNEVIDRGTIVVDGNRIVAVGPNGSVAIPRDAQRVDVSGKTIIPGFIDAHAHMHYEEFEAFPQRKWAYIANLAYGVTSSFDPSAHNLDVFAQQEMVETGEMLGPRIFSTGDVIYGSEALPVVYENIRSIDDARAIVRRYKPYGPEMLKEYVQPRRDQRQWLAQAAREEGVEITAEGAGDLVLDLTMVLDGYTAWEHALPIAPLYNDVVQLVARSAVYYTPTLIVGYGGPTLEQYFATKNKIHDDPKLRRFTPEWQLERWRKGWTYVPDDEWHFMRISESAAKITHAGGLIALGAHGNRQGLGAQWELWGLQMGGLTNAEALREATIVPARKLGYDRDLGSLEPGKLADFLVLDANPLDDIHNTAALHYTVKNGVVFDAASMTELWPEHRPLARFFWQNEEERKRFAAPLPPALDNRSAQRRPDR